MILVWRFRLFKSNYASTHRAEEMNSFLCESKIDQIMTPLGTTCYLQSLDLCINKPLKETLMGEINDYIEKKMTKKIPEIIQLNPHLIM